MQYFKIKMKLPGGGHTITWAQKVREDGDRLTFVAVDKEGMKWKAAGYQDGVPVERIHYLIGQRSDFAWIKPARMNLHYGELELIK